MASAAGICTSCGHLRTVQPLFKASSNLNLKNMKAKSAILPKYNATRSEFAKTHMPKTKELKKIIFSVKKNLIWIVRMDITCIGTICEKKKGFYEGFM